MEKDPIQMSTIKVFRNKDTKDVKTLPKNNYKTEIHKGFYLNEHISTKFLKTWQKSIGKLFAK